MKKSCLKKCLFCLLLSLLLLCNHSFAFAKSKKTIKLSKTSITLQINQSKKLSVKNTKKKIKWTSSNKKIAIVNKSGKVTGKKIGKATITAKVGKKKLRCRVTIKKKPYRYTHHSTAYYKAKRNQIYNELGINNTMKPQYICFLLAKWECDNVKYSNEDANIIYTYAKKGITLSYRDWANDDLGQTYQQALDFGTAVCGGYSNLYKFLLDGMNIECTYYRSAFPHAWNRVKIDGKWYAVDVTCMDQEDSIPNLGEEGRYGMECFLVPDKYMPFYLSSEDKEVAKDYRFFKTIYEELITYGNEHPDIGLCALDHWDKNGKFIGNIADYAGTDYHCNPWFTGTWVNY